ncbi:MAG: membrane dipeptidase [Oscillospiraceae bacterium]|nr:membrane dipeptidase [Oscillospiraceae bacterium]
MDKLFLADAHSDTISRLHKKGEELYQNSGHIDLRRAQAVNLALQFFAVWVPPGCKTPFKHAGEMIKTFHDQCSKNMELVAKIRASWDFDEGKMGAFLTLEGGGVLEGKLSNLDEFYNMGVRLLTLCWNGENELGFGEMDLPFDFKREKITILRKKEKTKRIFRRKLIQSYSLFKLHHSLGLKNFGIKVVQKMEDLGMLIDVSHLSEDGFWDVVKHTKKGTPIFATHSNCKAICNHPRNLTDEQIKIIIERNGFIGLNVYPPFLGGDDISLIAEHAAHIISLGGEDCLGLGLDFDGVDKLPKSIHGIENAPIIIEKLSQHFDENLLRKILSENLIGKMK